MYVVQLAVDVNAPVVEGPGDVDRNVNVEGPGDAEVAERVEATTTGSEDDAAILNVEGDIEVKPGVLGALRRPMRPRSVATRARNQYLPFLCLPFPFALPSVWTSIDLWFLPHLMQTLCWHP